MPQPEKTSKKSIRNFSGVRQSNLFRTFKDSQFTGKVILHSLRKEEEWYFYLSWGRIIYATGGEHSVRRWVRNIRLYAPNLLDLLDNINPQDFPDTDFQVCWEYDLLKIWLEQNLVTLQQIQQIIRGVIVEIFFDLSHTMEIFYDTDEPFRPQKQLVLFNADQLITQSWQDWQKWQGAKLADRSPNKSPLIYQPNQLKQHSTPNSYKMMKKLFNGENSLRDLSLYLQQDLVVMTRLIIPYLQKGFIDLVSIDDLPVPWLHLARKKDSHQIEVNNITISCVSDQFSLIEEIKQLVKNKGYKLASYSNSQLAFMAMLAHPPQLIILDFDLKNIDIYEFSAQLRYSPLLVKVPIIIMSNNVNILSRWKSKRAGVNDFLSKPIDRDSFKKIIKKYLTKPDEKK